MASLIRKLRRLCSLPFKASLRTSLGEGAKRFKAYIFSLAVAVWILGIISFDLYRQYKRSQNSVKSLSDIRTIVEDHIILADNELICEDFDASRDHRPFFGPHIYHQRNCDNESTPDWVTCRRSKCSINLQMAAHKEPFSCDFTDIFWNNDFSIERGRTYRASDHYILEDSNYVEINCTSVTGETWLGVGAGTRRKHATNRHDRMSGTHRSSSVNPSSTKQFNVVVLILDSLSRNAFVHHFPLSYNYLKGLGGFLLKGYNIVGDERLKNIMPIIAGRAEFELPDARRRVVEARPFHLNSSIFQLSKRRGYVTGLNENVAAGGVFTTRHKGFAFQHTDHYLRNFFLANQELGIRIDEDCVGSRNRFQLLLDHISDIFWRHPDHPKLLVNIHSQLSHGPYRSARQMDANLFDWLKQMGRNKAWNDSILIIMSDKGESASGSDYSLEQKIQERTPFVSFVLPEAYRFQHPYNYAKFLENVHRLSTPFDLYSTLLPIVAGFFANDLTFRAFSLFSHMPSMRSCASAHIEPQWCACRSWEHIEGNLAETAASKVVETINKATETHRENCAVVRLSAIVETLILRYQPNLLKFQGNEDKDGYEPNLTGDTRVLEEYVRIKITVQPGLAIFEGNVTFDRIRNKYSSQLCYIMRLVRPRDEHNRRCLSGVASKLVDYCVCSKNKP